MKVLSFWGKETNPCANADTCFDGGGYFQPAGGCLLEAPGCGKVVVEYGDYGCGGFGSREHWQVVAPNGDRWFASIGSMDDCSDFESVSGFLYAIRHRLHLDPDKMMRTVRNAVNLAAYGYALERSDVLSN